MSKPIRILKCSVLGCDAAWYEIAPENSLGHSQAVRRARIAGWTSGGAHGCMCVDRDAKCPEHSKAVTS